MRIISQNGCFDVPYEQVFIEVYNNEIWCGCSETLDKHRIGRRFATYSNSRKAEKALQKLHEAYVPKPLCTHKYVSPDERAAAGEINEAQAIDEMHTGMFVRPISSSSIEQVYTGNIVFRFPREDEM